ncbi:MAG: S-layer homology domain-containing protein, partial [Oscillospiraceae bacterium]|nr:S-layer homology domain-containing protein [Oscillospiraceae bacterium]
ITSVTASGSDGKGATNQLTLTFARPISLLDGDLTVTGAALKDVSGGTAVSGSGNTQYTIAVQPQMDHKTGDLINVSLNLGSDNLAADYHFQLSNEGQYVADSVAVAIPRVIASAQVIASIPDYAPGYIQFTLDRAQSPIDTAALEAAINNDPSDPGYNPDVLQLTVGGQAETPVYIYRVDADMGYTFRLLIKPNNTGSVTLALPGFGVAAFDVTGTVDATSPVLDGNAFALDAHGNNYLTALDDAHQILPDIDVSGGLTAIHEAPALELRVNRESNGWTVDTFYLDDAQYNDYTTSGGGQLTQIFDGVSGSSDYPDLTDYLSIKLPAGWTDENGTHTFRVVLTDTASGEHVLLLAKTNVQGILPYTLTVVNGTGGGSFKANATVTITGGTPQSGMVFAGWIQDAQEVDPGYITLPTGISGTITMPKASITLTAQYNAVLTVVNGTGGGDYLPGTAVNIAANTPPSGMVFDSWTQEAQDGEPGYIDPALLSDDIVTITMPAAGVTLTAKYKAAPGSGTGGGQVTPPAASAADPSDDPADDSTPDPADDSVAQTPEQTAGSLPFSDVGLTDWFYNDIAYVYDKGLMVGTGEGSFSPSAPTTRGMIVTIIGRYSGADMNQYSGTFFTDVTPGQYYAPYTEWAAENGIVAGIGDSKFAPDSYITREQFTTILYNYYKWQAGETAAPPPSSELSGYTDAEQISSWAQESMRWAHANGIVVGRTATTLVPQGVVTRAESAALLRRFMETFSV